MDIIWYLKYLSRIHEANMNLIFLKYMYMRFSRYITWMIYGQI